MFSQRESRSVMSAHATHDQTVETQIPARLDRLPWALCHWLVVVALRINVDPRRARGDDRRRARRRAEGTRHAALVKLRGQARRLDVHRRAVTGALAFEYATDRLGRRKLFIGAEYSAINSAIDELIPRQRPRLG